MAFAAFCLASSAVYAWNDVLDRHRDAKHPRKSLRPVASGAVSAGAALATAALCAGGAAALGLAVGPRLLLLLGCYGAINAAYSRWLKRVVLLDVFCIASGFLLRLLAGTWGLDIPPSQWFLLCTFLLSLFLGFSKRYAERVETLRDPGAKREVMGEYSPELLRSLLSVTLACTLLTYGLYTMSPRTAEVHATADLIYTLPFAAFALFRYLLLVLDRGFGEDTVAEVLRDKGLFWGTAAYLAAACFILLR
jgi:4-hydroxybenzoate polyprenyltransferase